MTDTVQAMVQQIGAVRRAYHYYEAVDDCLTQAAALLLSLQAELGEARRDAERYRWIKENGLDGAWACRDAIPHSIVNGQWDLSRYDDFIDAARESARGDGNG